MIRGKIICLLMLTLALGCVRIEPVDIPADNPVDIPVVEPEEPVETFTLDGVPTLKVSTLAGAPINSRSSYTMGASCVLEYSETSSISGESVLRTVDYGGFSIKGRGNSTWSYPKKPYLVKLDLRQEVFGMGKGRTWCLLANWMDKTLLRNDVAFEIASRCSGLDWTPKGVFVELELNGKDLGLYYLCPHISLGKDRVNAGDDGIIFELDTYYDEPYKFRSVCNFPVMVKDFEVAEGEDENVLAESRFTDMKNGFLSAESYIKNASACRTGRYSEFFDLDSMVDFYIVNDLVGNGELCHPKSCYMYFNSKDSMYYFGPVWDFDWGTMVPDTYGLIDRWTLWYQYLFSDPLFVSTLKERWELLKPSLEDIGEYIDTRKEWIEELADKNFRMWPISSTVNGDEKFSFSYAVDRLESSLSFRISELDRAISALK